jgi:hypothetical protein
LLLNVARCRTAVRVLCRLDAGEELRLDAAVGCAWTAHFQVFCLNPPSYLLSSPKRSRHHRFPLYKSPQAPLKEIEASPPARLSRS